MTTRVNRLQNVSILDFVKDEASLSEDMAERNFFSLSCHAPLCTCCPRCEPIVTLGAKLSGAVYCNRFCLCVCLCMCVCVCVWGLLPRLLEIACIDPHQTGSVGEGSDHLQLIKFWPSRTPAGRGSAAGQKILALPYYSQRAVFASPLGAFFLCCSPGEILFRTQQSSGKTHGKDTRKHRRTI